MYNLQAAVTKALRRAKMHEQKIGIRRFKPERMPCAMNCQCKACRVHQTFIAGLNPKRYAKILEDRENKGFRRNKPLPDHVHARRLLAYSLGTWRG